MATDTPLSHLALLAASVADDLGYVALADLARAVGDDASGYRVIGGHMVTVLAARWMLGADLYRETGDADLGVTPVLARSIHLPGRLKALGYEQVAGNRFARGMSDIPVTLPGVRDAPRQAIIDLLIPAYTHRARENVKVSEDLFSTEVPGLAAALGRPAGHHGTGVAPAYRRDPARGPAVPLRAQRSGAQRPGHTSQGQGHRHDRHLAVPGDRVCRKGHATGLLPQWP
ncbi:MAG: hypothetical protein ABSB01_12490 [Streptosporangiaceae bacterium]|jgi:hypothetical protein